MATPIGPQSSFGKMTTQSAAANSNVAKAKNNAAKTFNAATNNVLQAPQTRVAPKTVQMQKGAVPDKGARPGRVNKFSPQSLIGSFKKGGRVHKTGVYLLHKGEHVLNRDQTKRADARVQLESPLARILGEQAHEV